MYVQAKKLQSVPDRSDLVFKASRVIVTRAETLKPLPPTDDLVFGRVSRVPFYETSWTLCSLFFLTLFSTAPII